MPGLRAAAEALELELCDGVERRNELPGFDYVFLVDDRDPTPELLELLGDSVRDRDGRRLVSPSRTVDGHAVRALVVGEAAAALAPSDAAWIDEVRNAANWAHLWRLGIPRGKGIFFQRTITGVEARAVLAAVEAGEEPSFAFLGSPSDFVTRLREAGIQWVAWPTHYHPRDTYVPLTEDQIEALGPYLEALHAAEIDIFAWRGAPEHGNAIRRQVEELVEGALHLDATGIILDPEAHFSRNRARSEALMTAARELAEPRNLSVGVTSLGRPQIPLAAFIDADYGLPQIYDRCDTAPAAYPPDSVRRWSEDTHFPVVPISGAHHCAPVTCAENRRCSDARAKTEAEMRQLIAETPITDGAMAWWSWRWLKSGNHFELLGEVDLENPEAMTTEDQDGDD